MKKISSALLFTLCLGLPAMAQANESEQTQAKTQAKTQDKTNATAQTGPEHDEEYRLLPVSASLFPSFGTNDFWGEGEAQIVNHFALNLLIGHGYGLKGVEVASLANWQERFVTGVQVAGITNLVGDRISGGQIAGIWNHSENHTLGFQIAGLSNYTGGYAEGVQIAGLSNIIAEDAGSLQIGGIFNSVGKDLVGLQFGGAYNHIGGDIVGLQTAGLVNHIGGDIVGLQTAGLANHIGGDIVGLQTAGLANHTGGDFVGLQTAVLANHTGGDFGGLQTAGLANHIEGNTLGFQVSGVSNVSQGNFAGGQIGLVNLNLGSHFSGAQVGLVNIVSGHMKGLQFGLFNYSDDLEGSQLGVIGIVNKRKLSVKALVNEVGLSSVELKTGGEHLYSNLILGYRPPIGSVNNLFSLGLGIGTHIPLGEDFFVDIEGVTQGINEQFSFNNPLNLLNTLRFKGGWKATEDISLIGGLSLNLQVHAKEASRLSSFSVYKNENITIWPGLFIGLEY